MLSRDRVRRGGNYPETGGARPCRIAHDTYLTVELEVSQCCKQDILCHLRFDAASAGADEGEGNALELVNSSQLHGVLNAVADGDFGRTPGEVDARDGYDGLDGKATGACQNGAAER